MISIPLDYGFLQIVDAQRKAETTQWLKVDDILVRDFAATRRGGRKAVRCNLACPTKNDHWWEHSGSCQKVYAIVRQQLGEQAIIQGTVIY